MKKKNLVILVNLCALLILSGACGLLSKIGLSEPKMGEIKEFQLWSGNTSLPPQYQRLVVIKGKIEPQKIIIEYSNRKGREETKKQFELTGADYEKYVQMVRNTALEKEEARSGGGEFDVTLSDATGKNKMGSPSNGKDWGQFEIEMEKKANSQ